MTLSPVVVGIDGSDHSLRALSLALNRAGLLGTSLHVVQVVDVTPAYLHLPGDMSVNTTELAEVQRKAVWEMAKPVLKDAEVEVKLVDLTGYPADELVEYTRSVDAVLLVVGTRGRGRLSSTFLGSTSLRAVERAHCDVLVAKPPVKV